ncbi:MAG: hypothetical protein J5486_08285 [Bacteroidaceae bacterium]|nr:hypothetical protein [Bacteroidaceae bacterium]
MKQIVIAMMCVLALTACNMNNKGEVSAEQQKIDSLNNVNATMQQQMDEMMTTINEVQEAFQHINEAEGRIAIANANPESGSSRESMRENLLFIQQTMEDNRQKIARLEERLQTASFNTTRMTQLVERLQQQLAEQNQRVNELEAELAARDIVIAQQGEQIGQLSESVDNLSQENAAQQETISSQDADLHAAWYVFGTKNELKEQRIITKEGVLRTADFNKGYFTKIDIRIDKEIALYSKNAQLLTSHPAGSYTLAKNSEGKYVLTITDPDTFWSTSKYLVVQVK